MMLNDLKNFEIKEQAHRMGIILISQRGDANYAQFGYAIISSLHLLVPNTIFRYIVGLHVSNKWKKLIVLAIRPHGLHALYLTLGNDDKNVRYLTID